MDVRRVVLAGLLLAPSCTGVEPTETPRTEIEVGSPAEQVRGAYGEPDRVLRWTVNGPRWGPGEQVAGELADGTEVESWIWVDGEGNESWVHLVAGPDGLAVVGTDLSAAGVVYEAEGR